jgi:hypothetical protein
MSEGNKIHNITAEFLSHDAAHVNKTLFTIVHVAHHSAVHHPLESCYDSLVDESQLSYQGSTFSHICCKPASLLTLPR